MLATVPASAGLELEDYDEPGSWDIKKLKTEFIGPSHHG
jgi:hypothetical protein